MRKLAWVDIMALSAATKRIAASVARLPLFSEGRCAYMIEPYKHRVCFACGKRIPRWTDGKATPASRVYCGNACGNHYRRRGKGRVTKGVAQNVKKRPINRAPFESIYVTEPRPDYPPCKACGRPDMRTSPAERFCSNRCAEYIALRPRKPDGEWFIVVGRWTIAMDAALPLRRASHRDL
jgi:predicted nucleic acid-binding Zn ribbon protein